MFAFNTSKKKRQSKRKALTSNGPSITAEEFYHVWTEVWERETFSLTNFVIYASTTEEDGLRFLQQMEYAGYLILGQPKANQIYVIQHLFKREQGKFVLTSFNSLTTLSPGSDLEEVTMLDQIAACKRLWTSMRIWSSFSIRKLELCSHTSHRMTEQYVQRLYRLGYLRLTQTQTPDCPSRENVYQLIDRNAKRIPPFLSDTGRIYDFNHGEIYLPSERS